MNMRLALIFSCLLCATVRVWAHDPFEITVDARPRPDGLEVRLTLAWVTCLRASHEGRIPEPWIRPEQFQEIRPMLARRAAGFFTVAAADGPLALCDLRLQLTVENDVELVYMFAPPAKGTARFHAALLEVLPQEGYGARLTVLARDGAFLGQETLWATQPIFEVPAAALQ